MAELSRRGLWLRARALWPAARAAIEEELARRRERRAFRALGLELASGDCGPVEERGAEGEALREAGRIASALERLAGRALDSLERDREDYASAPAWATPLTIARGLLDRAVLGSRSWALARAHRDACESLGRAAHARLAAGSSPAAAAALRAFEQRKASRAERRRLLSLAVAPRAADLLPAVRREASALGLALARELRGQLLPGLPGLAGLAAGWWLAQTFTDSSFHATLHRLGLGSGPRRSLDPETYRALAFWLPLMAATLCSYGSARIAGWVRARYAPDRAAVDAVSEGGRPLGSP